MGAIVDAPNVETPIFLYAVTSYIAPSHTPLDIPLSTQVPKQTPASYSPPCLSTHAGALDGGGGGGNVKFRFSKMVMSPVAMFAILLYVELEK